MSETVKVLPILATNSTSRRPINLSEIKLYTDIITQKPFENDLIYSTWLHVPEEISNKIMNLHQFHNRRSICHHFGAGLKLKMRKINLLLIVSDITKEK